MPEQSQTETGQTAESIANGLIDRQLELVDNGGHFYGEGSTFKDLNAIDGLDVPVSLDHIVTNTGSVLVRVNGTPLSDLAREPYRHHTHDETGGLAAAGGL